MGFILPWSLFWRWGKYAPCGLLANFRADTSIASQHRLFFKKEKDLHLYELSQNLQVLCVSVTKEIPCFEREKSTIVEKFNCFLSLWAIAASIPDTLTL